MNQPLFSILIANYNNGKYFRDCFDSIMAQTYPNWEAIIVDDASTDNSVEVIKKIMGDDTRFKLVTHEENKGTGYIKRELAEIAKGEICAFLDPDDAINEDALSDMVIEHEKYPNASIIYSKPIFCDSSLNFQYEINSEQIENGNPCFFDLEGKVFAFLSYKKIYYLETEGISSYLLRAVDKDLVLKLYEVGNCLFLNKSLYNYRIHSNGISTGENQDKAYFWYWVTIIDAAKRRNVNIENLFIEKALISRKQLSLQKEIDTYNKSVIFKIFRKLGLFKIFIKS